MKKLQCDEKVPVYFHSRFRIQHAPLHILPEVVLVSIVLREIIHVERVHYQILLILLALFKLDRILSQQGEVFGMRPLR